MNIRQNLSVILSGLFLLSAPALSVQVTATFNTGETLDSSKLGDLVTQINDNDDEVTALQTHTGSLVNACSAGSSIRSIAADGTVVCEIDDDSDTTYNAGSGLLLSGTTFSLPSKTHYLMIPAVAFRPVNSDTTFVGGTTNPFMNITGGSLSLHAAVNLPHGAVITGLSMRAWDVSSTNSVTIELRKYAGSAITSVISTVATTTLENVGYYVKSDNSINESVFLSSSNHNFYYLLQTVEAAGTGSGPGIYAVRVTYTY